MLTYAAAVWAACQAATEAAMLATDAEAAAPRAVVEADAGFDSAPKRSIFACNDSTTVQSF